jgi:hypothetical protein
MWQFITRCQHAKHCRKSLRLRTRQVGSKKPRLKLPISERNSVFRLLGGDGLPSIVVDVEMVTPTVALHCCAKGFGQKLLLN